MQCYHRNGSLFSFILPASPPSAHAHAHARQRRGRRCFLPVFYSTSLLCFHITVQVAADAGGFPLLSTLFRSYFLPDRRAAVSRIPIGWHSSALFKVPSYWPPGPRAGAIFVEGSEFTAVISPSAAPLARPPSAPSLRAEHRLCCVVKWQR